MEGNSLDPSTRVPIGLELGRSGQFWFARIANAVFNYPSYKPY